MCKEYEEFHTTGKLWNIQQQKLLSDEIEIHLIEIPKLMQQWREEKVNLWEDSFSRWLLLANEDEHLMEEITINQDQILQKEVDKWEYMSQGASFRKEYEVRGKALMDEVAGIVHALNTGWEQELQEGKRQMILDMHRLQMPIETISQASK